MMMKTFILSLAGGVKENENRGRFIYNTVVEIEVEIVYCRHIVCVCYSEGCRRAADNKRIANGRIYIYSPISSLMKLTLEIYKRQPRRL
jgi:hypothetical protein